jgi:hypothetical protein
MKTAIYIEDGAVQLVITPESDFEKNALKAFEDKPTSTRIHHGSFYHCQGGWARHGRSEEDRSLILRTEINPTTV